MIPWASAWQHSLYGVGGFYRRSEGPRGHFTTSAHQPLGSVFAEALATLASRHELRTVVDIGAGRGELLREIAGVSPNLDLLGVDIVDHPAGTPAWTRWLRSPGGATLPDLGDLDAVLVIANEWLDVVPLPVATIDGRGDLRYVLVDPDGSESVGDVVSGTDLDWVNEWWPAPELGERVEIGVTRDEALRGLFAQVRSGVVVAIDYGHVWGLRPRAGSLVGYRSGQLVDPVPDGSCDLTAHVAVDSLPADRLLRQRDALTELLGPPTPPSHELARRDPMRYLNALERKSALSTLCGPVLGDFWWAISEIG